MHQILKYLKLKKDNIIKNKKNYSDKNIIDLYNKKYLYPELNYIISNFEYKMKEIVDKNNSLYGLSLGVNKYIEYFYKKLDKNIHENFNILKNIGLTENVFCELASKVENINEILNEYTELQNEILNLNIKEKYVILPKIVLNYIQTKNELIKTDVSNYRSEIPEIHIKNFKIIEHIPEEMLFILERDSGDYRFYEYNLSYNKLKQILKENERDSNENRKDLFTPNGLILKSLGNMVAIRLFRKKKIEILTDKSNIKNDEIEKGMSIFYLDFGNNVLVINGWVNSEDVLTYSEYKRKMQNEN